MKKFFTFLIVAATVLQQFVCTVGRHEVLIGAGLNYATDISISACR